MRIHLLTTLFDTQNTTRYEDFKYTYEINLKNPLITNIHIFFENTDGVLDFDTKYSWLLNDKTLIWNINGRPGFNDFLRFVKLVPEEFEDQDIIIIANADIFFADTLVLLEKVDWKDTALALTRYNLFNGFAIIMDKCLQHYGTKFAGRSTDAWILRVPVKEPLDANIKMGILGCDDYFNFKLQQAGYKVINPCLSIHCFHKHDAPCSHTNIPQNQWYYALPDFKEVVIPFSELA